VLRRSICSLFSTDRISSATTEDRPLKTGLKDRSARRSIAGGRWGVARRRRIVARRRSVITRGRSRITWRRSGRIAAGALLAARRRNALACRVHALRIRTVVPLLHVGTRSLRGIRTEQTARQQTSTGTYRCATAAIEGCARSGTNCRSQSRTAQGTLTGSLTWRDTIKLTVGILPARSIVAAELIEGFSPAREGRETRTRRGHGTGTDKRQCDESG